MFKKTYNSIDIDHQFDKFEQTFTVHYNKNNPKNFAIGWVKLAPKKKVNKFFIK